MQYKRKVCLSIDFILETLKYEFTLFILILTNAILSIEFFLFSVKHMCAKVQNCPFIHLRGLSL